jgi:hypothetical protein
MFRLLILLPLLSLISGCASTTSQSSNEAAVRNAWFEALDRDNIALHDTLLLALFESRRTGRIVFVRRLELEGTDEPLRLYRISIERGGADNVVGVNYATREFLFDHYLPTDGPTLNEIRQSLRNDTRIRELKKDLGIFGP